MLPLTDLFHIWSSVIKSQTRRALPSFILKQADEKQETGSKAKHMWSVCTVSSRGGQTRPPYYECISQHSHLLITSMSTGFLLVKLINKYTSALLP